jgi:PGF-CTERM protein
MVAYEKGALVFAALDRRIRQNSDRGATLQGAIRRFNGDDDPLSQSTFLDDVQAVGLRDSREFAREHTETTRAPETWSREEHLRAFRGISFGYEFASPYDRSGPYRDDTAGGAPTVVTDETLALRVAVENTGENAGEYDVVVRADGERIARRNGTLEPGGRELFTVERTFAEPGEVRVTAGGATERVTVRRAGDLTVTKLSAPRRVGAGRPVDVTATVGSLSFRPAAGTVTIRADGRTIAERDLRLDANETAAVTGTVTFDGPGEYTVAAGDRSRTVRVVDGTPSGTTASGSDSGGTVTDSSTDTSGSRTASATAPSGGSGPGFGAVGAVAALVALVAYARRP